jgi:hypothetical protein
MIEQFRIGTATRLRKHDARRSGAHDCREVRQCMRSLDRIDAYPQPCAMLRVALQEIRDHGARLGLFRFGHRIFDIEQNDIRGAFRRFGHFAFAIARREQPGPSADALYRIRHLLLDIVRRGQYDFGSLRTLSARKFRIICGLTGAVRGIRLSRK